VPIGIKLHVLPYYSWIQRGAWLQQFLELKPEHVRTPRRNQDDESEGRREVSWIWMARSGLTEIEDVTEEEIGESKF